MSSMARAIESDCVTVDDGDAPHAAASFFVVDLCGRHAAAATMTLVGPEPHTVRIATCDARLKRFDGGVTLDSAASLLTEPFAWLAPEATGIRARIWGRRLGLSPDDGRILVTGGVATGEEVMRVILDGLLRPFTELRTANYRAAVIVPACAPPETWILVRQIMNERRIRTDVVSESLAIVSGRDELEPGKHVLTVHVTDLEARVSLVAPPGQLVATHELLDNGQAAARAFSGPTADEELMRANERIAVACHALAANIDLGMEGVQAVVVSSDEPPWRSLASSLRGLLGRPVVECEGPWDRIVGAARRLVAFKAV
ncbi:MAG: hypothetical protein H7Z43_10025 [Clostridia bacterium]|nr:hypothetical protein [Deltaproteobacteria bacterium]